TITREMILDRVWGYDFFGDTRLVDAHIKNIRKKMGISCIKTIKGIGYLMEGRLT
ncbi:DNA-binding response regulator, partial [Clostridium perfringens]|nr:DNA-binding response regulator [Clostridium perfringens]